VQVGKGQSMRAGELPHVVKGAIRVALHVVEKIAPKPIPFTFSTYASATRRSIIAST
jgi:hypothetical protein